MNGIDVAGWTLVHFLWQGAIIGTVAAIALRLCRHRSPQARYLVSCTALAVMLAAPPLTAFVMSRPSVAPRDVIPPRLKEAPWRPIFAPADSGPAAGGPSQSDAAASGAAAGRKTASAGVVTWLPIVVAVWLLGVVVLSMRLAGGWWRVRRLQRASAASAPSVWSDVASRLAVTLGLRRIVHVVDSAFVDTPMVIGWIRPVIVLPVAAFGGLSPSQVEAILAHELAHIRRHDFLVNLLQTLAETALFYHPAVWWISARIRTEREDCCDRVAMAVCGDAFGYAEALVELERRRLTHDAFAMAATGGVLLARIRRVLGAPDERPRRVSGMAIAAGLALLLGIAGTTQYLLAAQPADAPSAVAGDAQDPAAWSMIFTHDDSQMRFIGFRGRDLIRFAYQIPEARVIGGPPWLDEQILQIVVHLDVAPGADQMPGVVRQILEDRLQLQTHIEQRNFPVMALVMASDDRAPGPGLRPSARECFDAQAWIAAGQPPLQPNRLPVCGQEADSPMGREEYVAITMPQFAAELSGYGRDRLDVVDQTGLSGRYDIELRRFAPTAALMSRFPMLTPLFEPLGFPSIPTALRDQLGLELIQAEAPYDVIVIDQVEHP
jgi:uncharacterized protein (TIGR03435 family)